MLVFKKEAVILKLHIIERPYIILIRLCKIKKIIKSNN